MRKKYALGLLIIPACFAYACGGGDDSGIPGGEDSGSETGGDIDGSANPIDGTVPVNGTVPVDGTVSDTGSDTGAKEGGSDAGKDGDAADAFDAFDGNDGNYPFPIPDGGTVVLQFVGNGTTLFYEFLDGPQWVPTLNAIVFSDVDTGGTGAVYTYQVDAAAPITPIANAALNGEKAIGNFIEKTGGYYTTEVAPALDGGRVLFTPPDGGPSTVASVGFGGVPYNQPNDGVQRADGTIYLTDPDFSGDRQANTGIYRIQPDGGITQAVGSGAHAEYNGIALSPDQKTLYVSVTNANSVLAFPVNTDGSLGTVATFVAATVHGTPDGLAVDDAGNIYVGNTGGVEVYSKAGTAIGFITIANYTVTGVTFGGADRRTMFITANHGTGGTVGDDHLSALYRMYMNVPGPAVK